MADVVVTTYTPDRNELRTQHFNATSWEHVGELLHIMYGNHTLASFPFHIVYSVMNTDAILEDDESA